MIEPILVEVPNPAHPCGAEGVGEVGIVPPMAAIANAIDGTVNRRLTELPISPPISNRSARAGKSYSSPSSTGDSPGTWLSPDPVRAWLLVVTPDGPFPGRPRVTMTRQ
jgi:hypothetical protein